MVTTRVPYDVVQRCKLHFPPPVIEGFTDEQVNRIWSKTLEDGRVGARFMEHMITEALGDGFIHVDTKGHDIECFVGVTKIEVKAWTRRGCELTPSGHRGMGRTKNLDAWAADLPNKTYAIADWEHFLKTRDEIRWVFRRGEFFAQIGDSLRERHKVVVFQEGSNDGLITITSDGASVIINKGPQT